jgi:glutamine transport system permease protein
MGAFDYEMIREYLPWLLQGLVVTIIFTVTSLVLAVFIGIAVAVCRLGRLWSLQLLARVYVDTIRGTPLLLQLFILYYALPSVGIKMPAEAAGIIGLGINSGAYMAEIFRAGIEAVPRAHVHAARSLGMSYRQTLIRVELPQAAALVLPPLANEMISQVKATSLISTISIGELLRSGQIAVSISFAPVEIYLMVAILYLGVNLSLSSLVQYLEHRTGSRGRSETRRTIQDVGV